MRKKKEKKRKKRGKEKKKKKKEKRVDRLGQHRGEGRDKVQKQQTLDVSYPYACLTAETLNAHAHVVLRPTLLRIGAWPCQQEPQRQNLVFDWRSSLLPVGNPMPKVEFF